MAKKPKDSKKKKKPKQQHKATSALLEKKKRPAVQVVTCPSDFPTATNRPKKSNNHPRKTQNNSTTTTIPKKDLLDWHQTAKEIRNFGATAFVGQDKREHEKQAYRELTGRELKQQHVPLPIVRGMKKKRAQRQARLEKEAKEAGLVLPSTKSKQSQKRDRTTNRNARIHGPAPSVGFMKKGILKVSKQT